MDDGRTAGHGYFQEPASRYVLSGVVLVLLGLTALPATISGAYFLVDGGIPGGRWTAVVLLLLGAVSGTLCVVIFRRQGRMWHAALGIAILLPSRWVDTWMNDPEPRFGFSWVALVLPTWLAVSWARFRWRLRRAERRARSVQVSPPG